MAKSTVAVKFTGDVRDLKRATGEAEQELGGFGKRVGPALTKAMAGAGLAAGGALVDGFRKKMERDKVQGRLVGSLGLDPAEAARLGAISGSLYSDAFGENFEQVSEATAAAMQQLQDFADPDQLEAITGKALNLAYIFETEVAELIGAAGFLLRNGLAKDADEAFDVITVGLQKIPAEMRGEVLDAIGEYSQSFAALGFDAQDAFELIVSAGQNTSVGIDKVGDSVKEFLIRATDGSEKTLEALEAVGVESTTTMNALLGGGANAEIAFKRIIDGLLAIEDPTEQAQAAIALFGTPLEDLSTDQIPAFLESLSDLEGGFGDVEGAADDAADAIDTDALKYTKAMRKIEEAQATFVVRFIAGTERLVKMNQAQLKLLETSFKVLADRTGRSLDAVADGFDDPISKARELLELLGRIPGVGDLVNDTLDAIPGGPSHNQELQDVLDREAENRRSTSTTTSTAPAAPRPTRNPDEFVNARTDAGGLTVNIDNLNSYGDTPTGESLARELRKQMHLAGWGVN